MLPTKECWLFIDPGINGTGLAFFRSLPPTDAKTVEGVGWTVITSKEKHWDTAAYDIAAHVEFAVQEQEAWPEHVVIEFPGLWSASALSMASASSGDLFKLAFLTGVLATLMREIARAPVILISPQAWKGQLPKSIVQERVEKLLGEEVPNHAADAVGMGLAWAGLLTHGKPKPKTIHSEGLLGLPTLSAPRHAQEHRVWARKHTR